MAFYTMDGVRHESRREAEEYAVSAISEVPTFTDKFYVELHNHDWGKHHLQAVPMNHSGVYAELRNRNHYKDLMVTLADDMENDKVTPTSVNRKMMMAMSWVSMAKEEAEDMLRNIVNDNDYIYDTEKPLVQLQYVIMGDNENVFFMVDEKFEGTVSLDVATMKGEDPLEELVNTIKNIFVSRVSGEVNLEEMTVGDVELEGLLRNAERNSLEVSVKINTEEEVDTPEDTGVDKED